MCVSCIDQNRACSWDEGGLRCNNCSQDGNYLPASRAAFVFACNACVSVAANGEGEVEEMCDYRSLFKCRRCSNDPTVRCQVNWNHSLKTGTSCYTCPVGECQWESIRRCGPCAKKGEQCIIPYDIYDVGRLCNPGFSIERQNSSRPFIIGNQALYSKLYAEDIPKIKIPGWIFEIEKGKHEMDVGCNWIPSSILKQLLIADKPKCDHCSLLENGDAKCSFHNTINGLKLKLEKFARKMNSPDVAMRKMLLDTYDQEDEIYKLVVRPCTACVDSGSQCHLPIETPLYIVSPIELAYSGQMPFEHTKFFKIVFAPTKDYQKALEPTRSNSKKCANCVNHGESSCEGGSPYDNCYQKGRERCLLRFKRPLSKDAASSGSSRSPPGKKTRTDEDLPDQQALGPSIVGALMEIDRAVAEQDVAGDVHRYHRSPSVQSSTASMNEFEDLALEELGVALHRSVDGK